MDISTLYNVSSGAIKETAKNSGLAQKTQPGEQDTLFGSVFNSAVDNLKTTNSYIEDGKTEKIKLAMGETENTHDLTIALEKASAALTYTIAVRDKFLAAYKEITQMQV